MRGILTFRPQVLALLLITLFGGALRFAFLDRPPIWGDEAMTYSRVAGTYRELLGVLEKDGFGPLHYSAYWLLARVVQLDPIIMRLIPALAGSLMIPAIYFLARQMASVRTALLASLFTACSAYLLVYSRDAKMYMHFWLFCTLCMGSFLWWMRAGTRISFLCWVAAGCAMIGTHAPGAVILAIQPIFLLTHAKLRWWKAVCFVLGLVVIASGPVGYYKYFNQYQERTDDNWNNSGITWVADYNNGRSGPQVLLYTASAYLFSWEWPKDNESNQLRPWVLQLGCAATCLALTILALGAMPWPRRLRATGETTEADDRARPSVFTRFGRRVGFTPPLARAQDAGVNPTPHGLAGSLLPLNPPPTDAIEAGASSRLNGAHSDPHVASTYQPGAPSTVSFNPHDASPVLWWRRLFWLSIWIVVPTYAYYCASVERPTSPLEWWGMAKDFVGPYAWWVALETLVLGALCSLVAPLRGFFAIAIFGAAVVTLNIAAARTGFDDPYNSFAAWGQWLLARDVALGVLPVVAALAWTWSGNRSAERLIKLIQLVCIVAFVGLLCYGVFVACLSHTAKDIRMPRYLGVIWPAFAIAVAGLLLRLPTVFLRWPAIVFLLVANLFNFSMRLWADSEAPFARMAADVRESDRTATTTRTYYNFRDGGGPPGTGDLYSHQGRYALCIAFQHDLSPPDFRGGRSDRWFNIRSAKGEEIAKDLQNAPQIQRVIVWDRVDVANPDRRERLLPRLRNSGWTIVEDEFLTVRDHWDWREKSAARRRVYEKRIVAPLLK